MRANFFSLTKTLAMYIPKTNKQNVFTFDKTIVILNWEKIDKEIFRGSEIILF